MSRWRRAANVDGNQASIVAALRAIPGVTVITGHDDILVGHGGRTYWYEIKSRRALRKDGSLGLRDRTTAARQIALEARWRGHYRIVSTVEEIIGELFPAFRQAQEVAFLASSGASEGVGQGSGEIARPGGTQSVRRKRSRPAGEGETTEGVGGGLLTCGGRASR